MFQIPSSNVKGGTRSGRMYKPQIVQTVCPFCNEKVIFSLGNFSSAGPQNSCSATASCPNCSNTPGFWCLDVDPGFEMYMHPAPKGHIIAPDLASLPEPLRNSLVATIDAYNARIYSAAAVAGRRTLEGIFKYLVAETERNKPLNRLIETALASVDLAAPLRDLSHAIRSGGNLGAHFDMEREPDKQMAQQIVELLIYLISYLYDLPAKIRELETELGRPASTTNGS